MRIAILSLALSTSLFADKLTSPEDLCTKMQQGLKKAQPACVALSSGGGVASAVVISPDGLVLSAAHVASRQDIKKHGKITFEDGTQAEVKVLGWNIESDIGIYQITTPSQQPWPHAELAPTSNLTGEFCFTYSHPSGRLEGRPAQLRLGRIFSHSIKRGKPALLFADCNIQPGDSGGGLFSLEGKLIGINSSAANDLQLNIFAAIDQFHIDRKKLIQKKRWGAFEQSPANAKNLIPNLNTDALKRIQTEFSRRVKEQYPPLVDFVIKHRKPDGNVTLTPQSIVDTMRIPSITLGLGLPLSYGLDDPSLVKQLPHLPKQYPRSIPILINGQRIANGIALDDQHIVTKASLLNSSTTAQIHFQNKAHLVKRISTDKQWDLTILKTATPLPLPAIQWESAAPPVHTGDLLIAPDQQGRLLWGNATDTPRIVSKNRSIGPVDKKLISKHRAPYPLAIRNSLPLTSQNSGTPVFNKNGHLVGMYIARFSRTMGLIIPADNLRKVTQQMLTQKATTTP